MATEAEDKEPSKLRISHPCAAQVLVLVFLGTLAAYMEAMDDAALSDVTGQDGLSLNIDVPASTMDIIIHDSDGSTAGSLTGLAGALVIDNMSLSTGAGGIDVDIDADGGTAGPVDRQHPQQMAHGEKQGSAEQQPPYPKVFWLKQKVHRVAFDMFVECARSGV